MNSQIRTLYAMLAVVAAAAGGAWIASRSIESPAEAAARTAAPTPSPILVPIERRVLSSDVVTRGTGRFGLPQPVSIAPSALKPGPGRIATIPLRNTAVEEGQVLLTASGRPVFVLAGKVPAFRDLAPGISGEDVRQLEAALLRLGHDPGALDGVYDGRTAAAVAAWYRARGFEAFGPTRDQLAALRTLERDWSDAERARVAATTTLAAASEAIAAARATAEQLARAAALENATRAPDRRTVEEVGQQRVTLRVGTERARAEQAVAAAEADLRARMADRALIVLDPRQPETARLSADAQLELARAMLQRARLDGQVAVQTAEQDTQLAAERVLLAEAAMRSARLEGAKAVRIALDAQKMAGFDARVATQRAARLEAELAEAQRRLGVQVPADEIVFVASLPVRVEEVTAIVGASAAGPVLSVTDNQLAVDTALPLEAAPLVRPGMRVRIDERALGVRAAGVVRTVASTPGTRGVDGFHFHMEVKVDETALRLEGMSVRLTIPIESTNGAVLAVPVSAVSLAADGSSRVQVERGGALDYVTVTPGLAAGGFVEITAAPEEAALAAGTQVVVGYKISEGVR